MAVKRKAVPEVAAIQVLVSRYGDRTPHMLSAEKSIEGQLNDLAAEFGASNVTINGQSYADFADEYGFGRGDDTALPSVPDEKSDAELEQLIQDAEARGDDDSVAEIRRYQSMTPEERLAHRPVVEADGRVRVATRDPNELANQPPIQGVIDEPEQLRDVLLMSDDDLKAELRQHGVSFEEGADRDQLERLVTEERAKRLPK